MLHRGRSDRTRGDGACALQPSATASARKTSIRRPIRGCRAMCAAMSAPSKLHRGCHVFPDTNCHGPAKIRNGSTPSTFDGRELWGPDGDSVGEGVGRCLGALSGARLMALDPQAADAATRAVPGIPRDADGPVFREPWEAQAFAMALALHARGLFTWNEWAAALADEIKRAQAAGDPDTGETYYRHWLGDAGTAGRRERRGDVRDPAPLSRCLGPCRRPHAARLADRVAAGGFCELGGRRRVFPPALRAQRAGRAFAAAIAPLVLRAALAEIAGVGVFADQIDQPCPAELIGELPCRGLVQPHQRRVQFERLAHAEIAARVCSALMVSSRQSG